MFGWFGNKKRLEKIETDTINSFKEVKKDFEGIGQWIKHLHGSHEEVSSVISELRRDLSTMRSEFEEFKEYHSLGALTEEHKQLSKKMTVLDRQTAVGGVQERVQTAVQTVKFHEILQGLSGNERLLILTLMNSDLKLSYEDLARLLGKERSTIRGQINSIKQKNPLLIRERIEQSGKKRIFVSDEMREKLAKYAKVRVRGQKKLKKLKEFQQKYN